MKQYDYLMSACLCGVPCRYDGSAKTHTSCKALYEQGRVLLICPEVMGGLATPRLSCEIQSGCVYTKEGEDVTQSFLAGAKQAAKMAQIFGIQRAILKENSPSCGVHMIYDGSFSRTKVTGSGVCAALLKEAGLEVLSEEELSL